MAFLPLIKLLEQYHPWDNHEATHQTAILNLLNNHPKAFDRNHYEPGHITGSTWILAENTKQVALIYHRRLDRWLQPGGHAEPGETDSLTTALREAKEELGLCLDPSRVSLFDLDVHRIPETSNQPSHFHFDIRYLCLTEQKPLVSDSDAAQARWFLLSELAELGLDSSMQRMLDKVEKN